MVFKFVPVLALLAVAHGYPGLSQIYQAPALLKSPIYQQAPLIAQPAPLLAQPLLAKPLEAYDANPQYSFAYDIKDGLTGDFKNQQETLQNGVIKGQYSLIEPDGRQRIVDYIADPINGFNADVKYAGAAIAPAQPLIKTIAAPAIAKATLAPAYAPYAPALNPAIIKTSAYAPALSPAIIRTAPAYAPALIKAPALAPAAYATTLPYASTQYIKY